MPGAGGGRAPRQPWRGRTVPHVLGAADLRPGRRQESGTGAGWAVAPQEGAEWGVLPGASGWVLTCV